MAPIFQLDEGPLLAESGPSLSWISPILTSALPSEADIQLILTKGAANDPKRTFLIIATSASYALTVDILNLYVRATYREDRIMRSFRLASVVLCSSFNVDETLVCGDAAHVSAHETLTAQVDGGRIESRAQHMTLWRRQTDGS